MTLRTMVDVINDVKAKRLSVYLCHELAFNLGIHDRQILLSSGTSSVLFGTPS